LEQVRVVTGVEETEGDREVVTLNLSETVCHRVEVDGRADGDVHVVDGVEAALAESGSGDGVKQVEHIAVLGCADFGLRQVKGTSDEVETALLNLGDGN